MVSGMTDQSLEKVVYLCEGVSPSSLVWSDRSEAGEGVERCVKSSRVITVELFM